MTHSSSIQHRTRNAWQCPTILVSTTSLQCSTTTLHPPLPCQHPPFQFPRTIAPTALPPPIPWQSPEASDRWLPTHIPHRPLFQHHCLLRAQILNVTSLRTEISNPKFHHQHPDRLRNTGQAPQATQTVKVTVVAAAIAATAAITPAQRAAPSSTPKSPDTMTPCPFCTSPRTGATPPSSQSSSHTTSIPTNPTVPAVFPSTSPP